MKKTTTVNYPIQRVYNFLKNGNNFISKSIEKVKLNSTGTIANASIPGIGIIKIFLKADEKTKTINVYSNDIGTTISAKLVEGENKDKTNITFDINSNPKLNGIKNLIIKGSMSVIMDRIIAEVKKLLCKKK